MLPAYAGMIPGDSRAQRLSGGAPRVCGDDPKWVDKGTMSQQVLPAYAGMILPLRVVPLIVGGAPRVCGDDP